MKTSPKDNPRIAKVWITKYALTQGIITRGDAEHCVDINEDMISVMGPAGYRECFHEKDWHTSELEALDRASVMRDNKIASLKKQIEKLEALKF